MAKLVDLVHENMLTRGGQQDAIFSTSVDIQYIVLVTCDKVRATQAHPSNLFLPPIQEISSSLYTFVTSNLKLTSANCEFLNAFQS